LVSFLIALALNVEMANAATPPPKYKIDGNVEGWKGYQTGWEETGLDWSKVQMTPAFDDFDLKQLYYDNDETYLYLFLKFKPTVQERYDKKRTSGAFGYLYIDSDLNTNTGSTNIDADGSSTIPGADIQIWLPVGVYSRYSAEGTRSGCSVSYDIRRWDPVSKLFQQEIRKAESTEANSLVAHGKDGVEIAILLSDLQLRKGSKFSLYGWEMAAPRDYINQTTIEIR
jgi:hypothetical protein